MIEKVSGIYCIRNLVTGDLYIGQAVNLHTRKRQHFNSLKRGDHDSIYLQNAYNKYGKDNFVFETLFICEPEYLTLHEQGFVDIYNPHYNIQKICVNSNRGVTLSEETKHKISVAITGKPVSDESRLKMSLSHKGVPLSEETKKKLAEAGKGGLLPKKQDLN